MPNHLPHIAITLGDPAGIGTEIVLKYLFQVLGRRGSRGDRGELPAKITVIGDFCQAEAVFLHLRDTANSPLLDPEQVDFIDLATGLEITWGQGDSHSGECSFRYLERAIKGALAGEFQGIVTAPIAKSAWHKAGYHFPGQTEVLAQRSEVRDYGMLFVARSPHTGWVWRTLLATVHIPLGQVTRELNPGLIRQKLALLEHSLGQDFGIRQPQVAVVGINPHSGEEGYLGSEERDWLNPLLQKLGKGQAISPDTVWLGAKRAWYEDSTAAPHAYLAMYHDQGLIPMKLLAFAECVNCTIGLPFVRTSPDHGTAFDIAGKGIADYRSLASAVELAVEMVQVRQQAVETKAQ
ncbi:MAG: 4-hydroxythreonine-4-phosphate dehydrogenase PdxA [Pseudanabaenaceae cyanobacterium SKYGB_i_bin29]|nr:4-hydroxythreonine-4-phosphate dehydrogenase PdxA [Pseudanabaenaceae cyanobacterium SKYG29]MDW8421739.1 4-hydroxythreonine-4-phosphate dehydrogenase PdxA [Pseudanabaenaceae cyanobacterium SKYGB_i_bin29]